MREEVIEYRGFKIVHHTIRAEHGNVVDEIDRYSVFSDTHAIGQKPTVDEAMEVVDHYILRSRPTIAVSPRFKIG